MLMAVLALILTGIISYTQLPVQELPNVTFPFVAVTVSYPGTTPLDMENQVTIPLENAMSGINGISQMNGTSSQLTASILPVSRSTPAGSNLQTSSFAVVAITLM